MLRFAHLCEHFVRHMFRSHFELSTDMVFDQFPEEALILICHQIIKADTGTDKHFLDFRDLPQFTQQDQIIFVVCPHILARLWKQTLFVRAHALFQLFFACRMAKVGGRSADIVDIALEFGVARHETRLFQ